MSPELLDAEIAGTKALTQRPFGVNLITMHPQLADLIQVCARHGVGHVVLAGGLPPAPAIEAVKAFGAKLICFTPALSLGKKLLRSGVEALVIAGMEAGGHIDRKSVVWGKRGSVRVDHGGRRIIKKKKKQ